MISTSISAAGSTPHSRRREADPSGDRSFDPSVRAGSYARFSSSLQSEKSNADQQRECREMAQRNGHRILPELEFVDEAVSGTKRERAGLNALLAAAENGELHVLYFHSLSRLSRESVITLPLLKSLVHKHDVRVISVADNIDSDKTGWELIAHLMAIVHEHYITDLAANVLRGQEGTLLEGFSVGDGCFGYTSAPVAGSETGRRGRNAKPRKVYVMAAVRLSLSWLGVRKTLSAEQKAQAADAFGAEGRFLSAGKKLLDTSHPAFRTVTAVKNRVVCYWKGVTLPFPEPGLRLIRQDRIDAFDARMQESGQELSDAVAALDRHYDALRSAARQRLGSLYNAADYPATLVGLFAVEHDFPSVEPPNYLQQLKPELYNSAAACNSGSTRRCG